MENDSGFFEKIKEIKVGRYSLYDILIKVLLALLLLIFVPLMFNPQRPLKFSDMKVGSISNRKIVAPFDFFVLKTEQELKAEQDSVLKSVPNYFTYDDSITQQDIKLLRNLLPFLKKALPQYETIENKDEYLKNLSDELNLVFDVNVSPSNLAVAFDILKDKENVTTIESSLKQAEELIKTGVLNRDLTSLTRPRIVVVKNGVEENLDYSQRIDIPRFQKTMENEFLKHFPVNQTLVLEYLFVRSIKPNLIYDEAFSEKAKEEALANISRTKDMVYENELIVDKNIRIDADTYQKLYSLEMAIAERSEREGRWEGFFFSLGRYMLMAAILAIFALYLYSFRPKIFNDNKMLLMITIILLLNFIFAALISQTLDWNNYLIPTTMGSMLLAILIDTGLGFVGTVIIALVLGGLQGGGFDIVLFSVVGGMVAIYSVFQIRNRNQIFKAIIFISGAYFWALLSISLFRYLAFDEMLKSFAFYLFPNAIFSAFFTFMILGVFEKLFDITTDITLLELSDLNHPLLKKLSLEAPGTFHHSMVVGNLAEAAAKAIGANPLLARVGSYYHDIGKMEKPQYFVENQMNAENRHDQLNPNMSALILASHVKNGIELAKKYGIPKRIRDFIPEHHGTNLMSYFYNKAKEMYGEDEVNESDYRYPGPRPQSKETAIVMLADSVEAATRTLNNPTPSKLRAFIEDLVDKRFKEGELDDSDLTFKDLKKIIDAFLPVLYGVFQHRVEYPDQKEKKAVLKTVKSKQEKTTVKNGNSNS
ncbi:MAG: HDIG domain-containing protein [Caldisericaceae bacterium]|nr:HDIG domain-containing protein [Caldisericaceae bacterium]